MPNEYMQPFFDSLSQGVQVAQHLTNAALQMRQLDQEKQAQQQRQQLAQQEFDAQQQASLGQQLANGATPVNDDGTVSAKAPAPVYKATTRTLDSPAGMGLDLSGSQNVNLPADASRTYTVGGRTLQAPTLQDQLNREVAQKKAVEDAQRVPMGPKIAGMLGLPPDATFTPEHAAGLGSLLRFANPPQQDNSPTYQDFKDNDSGHVTRVWSDANGNVVKKSDIGKLVGEKESGEGVAARAMTENQRQASAEKALSDYQKLVAQTTQIQKENRNLQIALSTGTHYVDKEGNLTAFDKGANSVPEESRKGYQDGMKAQLAANQERLKQVVSDMQGAQNRYADLSGNNGARPQVQAKPATAGQTPATAAKPTAAQTPAKQQAGPKKVATMADLQAYATNKKITLEAAKKIALSKGYEIGQ